MSFWDTFGGDYVGEGIQMEPDYGGYDFGAIEMPDWSGYDLSAFEMPQDLSQYQWDTTLGQVISPGGTPGAYDVAGGGQVATPGLAPGAYDAAEGGGAGAGYMTDEQISALRDQGLAYQGGEQPFTAQPQPSWWDRVSGGAGTVAGLAEKALGSNIGRTGAQLGIGAVGLGAQQLFAGRTPQYQPPTYTPGAATRAGEAAMAAAAPQEARIRALAYPQVESLMAPGQEQPLTDPVQAAMRQQLMDVLSGGATGVSPATGRRQGQEEQEIRARLFRQLGPDYELTTPGIQSLQELKQRHNSEQYNERLATISSLGPQEQSRYQFGTTAPVSLYGQREGIRRGNLQDATSLTQLGFRGETPEDRANMYNTQLQAQGGLTRYAAANQRNANLATGIGSVFGTAAGTIGQRPPSSLETYFNQRYGTSNGFAY